MTFAPHSVEKTHAKRGRYIWGVGVTEEQLSDGPVREARSDTQDPLGVTYSSSPTSELEGLVRKLALGASRGFQRTATVLGPEGSGKTDVVGKLEERLKKELDDKAGGVVTHLRIPREAGSTFTEDAGQFVLDKACRELAVGLGLSLESAEAPIKALAAANDKYESRPGAVLVSGLDLLGNDDWAALLNVLAELPESLRIVLFTTRGSRACGYVVRINDLREIDWIDKYLKTVWQEGAIEAQLRGFEAQCQLIDSSFNLKELAKGVAKEPPGHLVAYHAGNQALTRLLGQTLLLERVHDAARRAFLETPTSRELLLKGVTRQLERDLASMAMPRPLVRYPEAFLDRLAQLALSTLDPKHLHAVRVLAQLPGPVSREFVEGMSEGLSDAPLVLRTVKPFLDLNPEARRAALLEDHVMVETRSTVDRRRRILDFPLTDGAFGKKAVSRAVDAVLRGDLGFLDLSEGPYAELIDLLLEPLHRATNALGSAPAMSLLKRLLLSDMAHATNLSLLERAKQLQLYGRELQEAAGIDWARANDGLAQLRAAFWIADHLRRIRSSLTRDLGFGDGLSKRSRLETDDVWLLALQAWRFARLRQGGGWHGILGLGTMPRPRDPAWDRGRHKDGALPEAAGEASGSEDESPNKDGVLSPMERISTTSSPISNS